VASRKWKAANRPAVNAYAKRWRALNPEKAHEAYLRHKPKVNQRAQYLRSVACEDRDVARRLRYRAMRHAYCRNIEFSLKHGDLNLPIICPVFGMVLDYSREATKKRLPNAATIDRIQNHLGYVSGNIVIISWRANRLKNDATIKELIQLADYYKHHASGQGF
jgi:hypothetical protein